MTNSLSEDIYALGELMATNLNTQGVVSADADDGLTTLAGKILDISASTTSLTIEVPLNLVYSDDFNITGTLTDGNDDAISGATVKLKVGNTVVDTDTTDNDGEVSFTQAPVSMGNHSFQLIFEGDSTHPAASSSVVTREIGKETTAITVSSPAASSSYYSDGSISVSGSLKTDDNEAISGASVLVKLGATTLTTLTTSNDGSFSGSVSAGSLSTGSNTLKFEFAGDSYYSTTYQEVAVTVNAVSLTLTSNKSILSYADGESATLTATYTGASVTGKPVTMGVYKSSDDSLVETLTVTDVGDGTYTASYLGKGTGDLYIKSICGSLNDTVNIEDCWNYLTSLPTMSESTIASGHYKDTFNTAIDIPNKVKFEYNVSYTVSTAYVDLMFGNDTSNYYYHGFGGTKQLTMAKAINNNRTVMVNDDSYMNTVTNGSTITITYDSGSHSVSSNGRTITASNSDITVSKFVGLLWSRNITINWIKIKPL